MDSESKYDSTFLDDKANTGLFHKNMVSSSPAAVGKVKYNQAYLFVFLFIKKHFLLLLLAGLC